MTLLQLLLLYVSFRIKQYLCDFQFQSGWMAHNKGRPGREGYKALFSHTAIHGAGTTIITLLFAPTMWWLGAVDFIVHSLVDRLKGLLTNERKWTETDSVFWWAFGLDQEAHNFSHLTYILIILMSSGGLA